MSGTGTKASLCSVFFFSLALNVPRFTEHAIMTVNVSGRDVIIQVSQGFEQNILRLIFTNASKRLVCLIADFAARNVAP